MKHKLPLPDDWYKLGENVGYAKTGDRFEEVWAHITNGKIDCAYGCTQRPVGDYLDDVYLNGWRESFTEPLEDILMELYGPVNDTDDWENLLEISS